MVKRISDISLPQKRTVDKKEKIIKKEIFSIKNYESEKKQKERQKSFSFFSFKKGFLYSLILFFLFFLFFLNSKFSKAEITILPFIEEIKSSESISVFANVSTIDFRNKIVPGQFFEKELTFSDQFESTGKTLEKAEGVIRLYNKYTTQEEVWAAGTRFVSAEGKVFKSKEKIIVPGATMKNGKIEPSFVDVPVIAAEGGKDYNIGPSSFSVLAFKGSPRFDKYEGKSFEPMKGGREVLEVKKEDLENAEKLLMEKTTQKIEQILKNEVLSDFYFLPNFFSLELLDKKSSAQVGERVERFNYEIKLKIKTIIFKKNDLLKFGENLLVNQISSDKDFDKNSIKIDFEGQNFSIENGKITLSLKISGKVFSKIDLFALKKAIAGKKINEVKNLLISQNGISEAKINIFPFWLRRIPEDLNKIEIIYKTVD